MKVLCAFLIAAGVAAAQNPFADDLKALWGGVSNNVVRAAEKMPEEHYSFKPVPEVMTFGQLVGHVADTQFRLCGMVSGQTRSSNAQKTKTSKADLVAAVKESTAFCSAVYDGITDARLAEKVKLFGRERTALAALTVNLSHSNEHYGNLVTYMRSKGLVPPSSEPRK